MFLPTEIELAGMKMREDHERKLTDGETVELKGFGDRDGKYVVKRDKQENGKCSLTKKEETGDQG